MVNSIHFNIKNSFEAFIGVLLGELDLLDDDYEELLQDLKIVKSPQKQKTNLKIIKKSKRQLLLKNYRLYRIK